MRHTKALCILTFGLSLSAMGSTYYCGGTLADPMRPGSWVEPDQAFTIDGFGLQAGGMFSHSAFHGGVILTASITGAPPAVSFGADGVLTTTSLGIYKTYLLGSPTLPESAVSFVDPTLPRDTIGPWFSAVAVFVDEFCYVDKLSIRFVNAEAGDRPCGNAKLEVFSRARETRDVDPGR